MSNAAIIAMVVFTLSLSVNIAELVISQLYMEDSTNTCHNDKLIKPALWLQWDGIIGIVGTGLLLMILLTMTVHREFGRHIGMCLLVPAMTVQFVWVIVGALSLWRDNIEECGPKPLHDMMWAAVLIHVILFAYK